MNNEVAMLKENGAEKRVAIFREKCGSSSMVTWSTFSIALEENNNSRPGKQDAGEKKENVERAGQQKCNHGGEQQKCRKRRRRKVDGTLTDKKTKKKRRNIK